MRAIILAAGACTRLRPYTGDLPKCLLPIHGRVVIDYQLQALSECGIDNIAVVTGYHGDKIRAHLADRSVIFIDNPNYLTTNNAYSIWLACDYALADPDGFILINSDLIFQPAHLRALVESPYQDGIIIDKNSDPENDMVKIEMDGTHILAMDKKISADRIAAEAVGPVKFSRENGEKFMEYIGSYIQKGDTMQWFFYMLGEFAQKYPFYGVWNPNLLWAEIDTPQDLEDARKRIPPNYPTTVDHVLIQ